jgi:predicted nucleotidyltransferase
MKTWTPPTPAEVEETIQEMVRRIVEGFHPEKIILFGSRARGNAGPDSDVDLLVVMNTESGRQSDIEIRIALDAIGIPKDIIVITPDEFERRKNIVGSIAYPAHHEGRVLYDRSRP